MESKNDYDSRFALLKFAEIYPLYLAKIERKDRTKEELDQVIEWLTGFDSKKVQELIKRDVTFEEFFAEATINDNAALITGSVCKVKVQEIKNPLTKKGRLLDKLVDELAQGKKMEKILRNPK